MPCLNRQLARGLGFVLSALSVLATPTAFAAPAFTGPDLSGTYDCRGQDFKEGPYTGVVSLQLIPTRSTGAYGSYDFRLDVPGYGSYPGHAAQHGRHLAAYFANTDPKDKDYGTGIAEFRRTAGGKWRFSKFYHEPEFKGGNYGHEQCTQR